ncbi:MAG: hypothetical protein KAT58_03100 [candidate division Zixibacteria bacterium]|nr:hypothetical protein [candidate division Zixibacteria bacterium]
MSSPQDTSLDDLVGKKLWVRYRLQSLTLPRFIQTVNRILRGDHLLLKEPSAPRDDLMGLSAERDPQ